MRQERTSGRKEALRASLPTQDEPLWDREFRQSLLDLEKVQAMRKREDNESQIHFHNGALIDF